MESCEICLFCYKIYESDKVNGEGKNETRNSNAQVNRFVSFLERFTSRLGSCKKFCNDSVDGLKLLGCCKPCGVIVDAFCDEYHHLQCLQMNLEWKLERLLGIMELGGRMPSRWLKLQEIFERRNPHASGTMNESLKHIRSYRQKIMKGCNKRLRSSQPRVSINRVEVYDELTRGISNPDNILSPYKINDRNKIKHEVEKLEKLDQEIENFDMDITTRTVELQGSAEPTTLLFQMKGEYRSSQSDEETSSSSDDAYSDFEDSTDQLDQTTKNVKLERFSDDPNPTTQISTENHIAIKTELHENNEKLTKSPVKLETQMFPCQQCSKTFSSKTSLYVHLRRVHVSAKFQCPTCKKMFNTSCLLTNHCKRTKHKTPKASKIFQCSKCSESCATLWLLGRHLVGVHSIHSCRECGQEFQTRLLRNKHLIDIHNYPAPTITLHECDKCGRQFKDKYKLRRHKISVHKLGMSMPFKTPVKVDHDFVCEPCGKKFQSQKRLNIHAGMKHNLSPPLHQCPECPKIFQERYMLIKHQKTHNIHNILKRSRKSSEEAICKFCSAQFPSRHHLAMHVRLEHVNNGNVGNCKLIQCSKCDSKFLNKYNLHAHIINVHTTAKYQCLECLKRFKLKQRLLAHQVLHGEKKIQCNECGAMFFTNKALTMHTKNHHILGGKNSTTSANNPNNIGEPTGEKERKHKCTECGKYFINAKCLREHLLTHWKGERLDCKHCDGTFKHSRALQRHCRKKHGIYTNKPQTNANIQHVMIAGMYECKECGKMWADLKKLKRHLATHEKGEPLICQYCGNKYAQIASLTKHVQRMHKDVQSKTSIQNNGE